MVYFVGEIDGERVFEIPASIVMASGYNPEAFTRDVLAYFAGHPAVAVSHEIGKEVSLR